MLDATRGALPVGREAELTTLRHFVGSAGPPLALVISGGPGIGKTTLWRAGLEAARKRGSYILAARANEAESTLSFTVLTDLLEPVEDDVLATLPKPQRHALDVALLRAEPGSRPPSPRATAAAFLSILRTLARSCPILIAVDDAHWLDAASAETIAFAARRVDADTVRFLLAQRSETAGALDEALRATVPAQLEVGGLSLGATRRLLGDHLGLSIPRSVLRQIHETTRGNPLFALEIGRLLAERGPTSADEPLPVPDDIRSLVRDRVGELPEPTRELLLAAALVAHPDAEALRTVLGRRLDGDLEPAERAGVASRRGGMVTFAHPLHASAVVASATSAERRRMHRRLAEAVLGLEERARHLALAVEGRDEAAAATIHAAAQEALLRGVPAVAAELGELAIELGEPEAAERPRRIVDLARFQFCAAERERSRALLADVDDWSAWPVELEARGRGQFLLSTYWSQGPFAAVDLGERFLDEELRPHVRATVHTYLSGCCEFDIERAHAHGDAALELLDALGGQADPGDLAHALAMRVRNDVVLGRGLDRALVDRAIELEDRLPPERQASERLSYYFGWLFKHVDDLDTSRAWLERDLAEAIQVHDEMRQAVLLTHLALTECWAGDLGRAHEHLAATDRLVEDIGGARNVGVPAVRALVEAHAGDAQLVRTIEATLLAEHGEPGAEVWGIYVGAAVGLIELSLGNDRAADERFTAVLATLEAGGHREPGVFRVHGNAGEAAVAVGDLTRAESIADALAEHAERTHHRWSRATSSRVRALVAAARGDLDAAIAHAEDALSEHDRLPMPLERARALLVKGAIERRAKRRGQARRTLEEAAEEFERTGARLWAERARAELARISGRRPSAAGGLTATERRVVELAANGLSNKEIARALFVTSHTVERHLSHAYAKLGVRSRAQLAGRLAEQPASEHR